MRQLRAAQCLAASGASIKWAGDTVTNVSFRGSHVSDGTFSKIAPAVVDLPDIVSLDLGSCDLTGACLQRLQELEIPNVRELDIAGSQITTSELDAFMHWQSARQSRGGFAFLE